MSYLEPYKISNIDLNKIVYTKIKENKNKKIISIKYNDNNKYNEFVFQTPALLNINKAEIFNEYSEIELALIGKEDIKINSIIEFLNELELKIKTDASNNAYTWFNDTNNDINFQKIIRKSEKYDTGTIKLKLLKTNDFETIIQSNNKRINPTHIQEDSWCKMIIECYAIWINSNNDFGIFLRPILVSFTPKESSIYKYKFADESDENDFDIPDTDINNDIFMKINKNNNNNIEPDDTSQIDYNELLNHLNKKIQDKPNKESSLKNLSNNLIDDNSLNDDSMNDDSLNESSLNLDETSEN